MRIEEKSLLHWIDNFYGYGSWDAGIWFVGYEESGGEVPEDVAEKLNYFNTMHSGAGPTLVDIRELSKQVAIRDDGPKGNAFTNRYDYRFGSKSILNGVWKNLIAFEHRYRHEPLPDPLDYQQKIFLSTSLRREALINLYPLPSPHGHAWYYSWLDMPQLPFLKSRATYEEQLYAHRMHTLLSNIRSHKPELVLMYGMNNINTLKKTIQEFFAKTKFKMIQAVPLKIPQHHRASLGDTTLVITTQIPALRHNRAETGFDWGEFGEMVRGNR